MITKNVTDSYGCRDMWAAQGTSPRRCGLIIFNKVFFAGHFPTRKGTVKLEHSTKLMSENYKSEGKEKGKEGGKEGGKRKKEGEREGGGEGEAEERKEEREST